ncbi:MAG: 3-deoxy-D-manno-octulosonic acid transferase [bacterium]
MVYYYAYNACLIAASPFLIAYLSAASLFSPRWKGTLRERLGFYGAEKAGGGGRRVWLHGVSVGEVMGAAPLVRLLLAKEKGTALVVTTTTRAGMETVRKTFGGDVTAMYFPFDFRGAVGRAVSAVRPSVLVLMETELWPNVIGECVRRGVPVVLLNGRVSDRAASAGWFVRGVYRWAFSRLGVIAAQSERDRERFVALGAPPEKVVVTGNMKFDGLSAPGDEAATESLLKALNPDGRRLFVAGSTHPGEEEMILDVHERLAGRELRLVLCPRHVERAEEVVKTAETRGSRAARRSVLGGREDAPVPDVVVLDTVGELRLLYRLAAVCFVGGSLVARGGHNVLEPAACGRAPFYGPHTRNFAAAVEILERAGAGIPARDARDLERKIAEYLDDPGRKSAADSAALRVVAENAGAVDRNYALVKEHLAV